MLYIYFYPENHKFERLDFFFISFLEGIRNINSRTVYNNGYFHEDFRDLLSRSRELNKKFKDFFDSYKILTDEKKQMFHDLVLQTRNINNFFSDLTTDIIGIKSENINSIVGNETFKILTDHLFNTTLKLNSFDIDDHYTQIYDNMPHKICPFCGIEPMHKSFREDYDHLAAKSIYPLFAVNPRNLAPMCNTCNKKYKREKDIFYKADGSRKSFVFPYSNKIDINFSYVGSVIPQTDLNNQSGKWVINIVPDDDITKNWDEIFGIKERYLIDFLIPSFDDWLDEFVLDCYEEKKDLTQLDVIVYELKHLSNKFQKKWYLNGNIIKAPLFDYLSSCQNEAFYKSIVGRYNRYLEKNLVA